MRNRLGTRRVVWFSPAAVAVAIVLSYMATANSDTVVEDQSMTATQPASRPASEIEQEYRDRFETLDPGDVEGHWALAEWCDQQQQYHLALKQSQIVLRLDSSRVDARLLRTKAQREVSRQRVEARLNNDTRPDPRVFQAELFVTDADVQKLRLAELQNVFAPLPGRPNLRERVQVRFGKNVLSDFLDAMDTHPDFRGRENRRRFYSLGETERLQLIRQHKQDVYDDRIEILSDPQVFKDFRKKVLPVIRSGCSSMDCHGGATPARPFGLREDRRYPDLSLYTNFVILDRVSCGTDHLINRADPRASLILEYGLPERFAERFHPTPIDPLFIRGPADSKYRSLLAWVRMLRTSRPQLGVKLNGYPEPPPPGYRLTGQNAGSVNTTTSGPAETAPPAPVITPP